MRSVIILLGLLLVAPGVSAAPKSSPKRTLAKKHFETGTAYYSVASYKEALSEFEKAYQLSALADLLFNIGRCHENLGNIQDSILYYKRYLAEHKGKPEPTVKLRIANLEKRLAEESKRPAPAESSSPSPSRGARPEPAPGPSAGVSGGAALAASAGNAASEEPGRGRAADRPRWKRTAGWVTLGVGVASLATGVAFGAMVRSKNQEYEDGMGAPAGWKTYDELQDVREKGERYQKIETATLVVGGVLAAAGAGLLVWDALEPKPSRSTASLRWLPVVGNQVLGVAGCTRF